MNGDEFFMGPFMTYLEPDEMLAEVVLPPLPARTGSSYQQVSRQSGGYAQAAVAAGGRVERIEDRQRPINCRNPLTDHDRRPSVPLGPVNDLGDDGPVIVAVTVVAAAFDADAT